MYKGNKPNESLAGQRALGPSRVKKEKKEKEREAKKRKGKERRIIEREEGQGYQWSFDGAVETDS